MEGFDKLFEQYEKYCVLQKRLDEKTMKAYATDLKQLRDFLPACGGELNKESLEKYCRMLHNSFAPRTVKRKIASAKAFCHWLEYAELIERTPFAKVDTRFREPKQLPRTMSLSTVNNIFNQAYSNLRNQKENSYGYRVAARDIAVLEMLFATGVRVSELSGLQASDINLHDGYVRILGKGLKERIIQIGNAETINALHLYHSLYQQEIKDTGYFFVNSQHNRYSEQSVRHMIARYAKLTGANEHVTPHTFRHTFATSLLEGDVDIRYIQAVLGHSSISTTQIYTHVTSNKQKSILTLKNPRNKINIHDLEFYE